MSEMYGVVAYPRPPDSAKPCTTCSGAGVTGEQFEMPTDRVTLVVDVFCSACGGCGNGDPKHRTCGRGRAVHPAWDDPGADDEFDPDVCPSCGGRRWNPMQAFSADRLVTLRVPCGCTADQVQMLITVET